MSEGQHYGDTHTGIHTHAHAHAHTHTGLLGCGIPQTISQQPLITEDWVQSQSKSRRIFGGQSGNVIGFSLCCFVSACQYLSTRFPHSSYSS